MVVTRLTLRVAQSPLVRVNRRMLRIRGSSLQT